MSSIPPLFAPRSDSAIDPDVVQQAIVWLVTLQSGAASEAEQHACAAWRQADPRHEQAWQRLSAIGDDMRHGSSKASPSFIRGVLRGSDRRTRRTVLKSLAGLGVVGGGFLIVRKQPAWQAMTADQHTATGEQRRIVLADGTELLLNTATAIDIAFDDTLRQVALLQGEIMVTTAPDPAGRPFEILTRHGRIHPVGTRFTVAHDTALRVPTKVAVLEGAVDVIALHDSRSVRVLAGQETRFTSDLVEPPHELSAATTAWTDGMLVVERMRLEEFVAELARYRKGVLRCDPAVADLRVSGAFPLRDTDAVLGLLTETLPIELSHATRFWTTVRPRAETPT